jgi:hypothetical protein
MATKVLQILLLGLFKLRSKVSFALLRTLAFHVMFTLAEEQFLLLLAEWDLRPKNRVNKGFAMNFYL